MKYDVSQNGRICLYDNARFVLICLVVIGHFLELHDILPRLDNFIHLFHMPAFILLAGMFHKNERIVPKIVSYLCISFILKLGLYLGNILISEADWPFLVFSEHNMPWFIFVLAGYTAASYFLQNIDKRFLLLVSILFGCFVGYDQTIGDLLALSRGFVFYPFYILGEMCSREQLAAMNRKPVLRLTGGAVLAGWAIICLFFLEQDQPYFNWILPFPDPNSFMGPIWRFLHYGVSILLCLSFICVIPARQFPVITAWGERTLQIYFWHWPIARMIDAVTGIGTVLCTTGPGRAMSVLFCIAVALLVGTKPFSFPTEHILYFAGVRRKRPFLVPKEKIGLP